MDSSTSTNGANNTTFAYAADEDLRKACAKAIEIAQLPDDEGNASHSGNFIYFNARVGAHKVTYARVTEQGTKNEMSSYLEISIPWLGTRKDNGNTDDALIVGGIKFPDEGSEKKPFCWFTRFGA